MARHSTINRKIVLNSLSSGVPTVDHFRIEVHVIPALSSGKVLLRTLYISLDPYMLNLVRNAPNHSAIPEVGGVINAYALSRVENSRHPGFLPGEMVLGYSGWQDYAVSDGIGLTRLDINMARPSLALGILGIPGFTAYMGLFEIGKPKSGETVVVAAASEVTGSVAGQIARISGCRVVGITDSADKCCYVFEELGFHASVNRNRFNFPEQLAEACPRGIDIYFESVGGGVFDAVLPLLNTGARVPLCGLATQCNNTDVPHGSDRLGLLTGTLLGKRITIQGYNALDDYSSCYDGFHRQMSSWLTEGEIKYRENIIDGLENVPKAFVGMLEDKTFSSQIVQVESD